MKEYPALNTVPDRRYC